MMTNSFEPIFISRRATISGMRLCAMIMGICAVLNNKTCTLINRVRVLLESSMTVLFHQFLLQKSDSRLFFLLDNVILLLNFLCVFQITALGLAFFK